MSYLDRHVVVTGGGGALGLAVVKAILAQGGRVHVPAFGEADEQALAAVAHSKLRVASNVNLADPASVSDFYSDVPLLWASLHLAGGFAWGAIGDATTADFDRLMTRNAKSCFLCCQQAARRITDGGRIVNVSAKPAVWPMANLAAYAASKGAVAALTLALSEELKDAGIWVNAVLPSIIDTPANRAALPDADFGDWPTVDEVASTILFLGSPANTSTRGGLIPVYGRA